jgi:hypothetical protein
MGWIEKIAKEPNEVESVEALKVLLEQYGMSKQVKVISSGIPYREV